MGHVRAATLSAVQAEMAGRADTAAILAALQATRANARERQDELERKIREEARSLRQGATAGARRIRRFALVTCGAGKP